MSAFPGIFWPGIRQMSAGFFATHTHPYIYTCVYRHDWLHNPAVYTVHKVAMHSMPHLSTQIEVSYTNYKACSSIIEIGKEMREQSERGGIFASLIIHWSIFGLRYAVNWSEFWWSLAILPAVSLVKLKACIEKYCTDIRTCVNLHVYANWLLLIRYYGHW